MCGQWSVPVWGFENINSIPSSCLSRTHKAKQMSPNYTSFKFHLDIYKLFTIKQVTEVGVLLLEPPTPTLFPNSTAIGYTSLASVT